MKLSFKVIDVGGGMVSERGFYWSMVLVLGYLEMDIFKMNKVVVEGIDVIFSVLVKDIKVNMVYYVYVYVVNEGGKGYSYYYLFELIKVVVFVVGKFFYIWDKVILDVFIFLLFVVSVGNVEISEKGFYWGIGWNDDINFMIKVFGIDIENGFIVSIIIKLNMVYYLCVYVVNLGNMIGYSDMEIFGGD